MEFFDHRSHRRRDRSGMFMLYTRQEQRVDEAIAVVRDLQRYARTGGRRFTREEMNDGEPSG